MFRLALIFSCVFIWGGSSAFAKTYKPINLIEVFTSQGCSSCPPAEDWNYQLKAHPSKFETFVTVEFHVDYWDYLGWKDRFSQSIFSKRQREYARQGYVNVVATPTVLLNGSPYRDWRRSKHPPKDKQRFPGLEISREGDILKVSWQGNATGSRSFDLWGSLLSGSNKDRISKGENAGRTLHHHHAALGLDKSKLVYNKKSQRYEGKIKLVRSEASVPAEAFALWVSPKDKNGPIVAAGGPW
ncbi:MAG: DUF1223 domain-containing protein [Pseudobacteriovorax sp.]|nr:DUF1223 domain-containing protein [Pseudobacteriovorax sp.]